MESAPLFAHAAQVRGLVTEPLAFCGRLAAKRAKFKCYVAGQAPQVVLTIDPDVGEGDADIEVLKQLFLTGKQTEVVCVHLRQTV